MSRVSRISWLLVRDPCCDVQVLSSSFRGGAVWSSSAEFAPTETRHNISPFLYSRFCRDGLVVLQVQNIPVTNLHVEVKPTEPFHANPPHLEPQMPGCRLLDPGSASTCAESDVSTDIGFRVEFTRPRAKKISHRRRFLVTCTQRCSHICICIRELKEI